MSSIPPRPERAPSEWAPSESPTSDPGPRALRPEGLDPDAEASPGADFDEGPEGEEGPGVQAAGEASELPPFTADDVPFVAAGCSAGAVVGAIVGVIDLGLPGGMVGGVVGLFAGFLFGYTLSILGEFVLGVTVDEAEAARPVAGLRRGVHRLLQLCFIAAVAHEIHWLGQFQSLCMDYQVALQLERAASDPDQRAALWQRLQGKRWVVAASSARPLVWNLRPEYRAGNKSTLQVIDWLTEERVAVPTSQPIRARPVIDPSRITPVSVGGFSWLPDDTEVEAVGDGQLEAMGAAIREFVERQFEQDHTKTLLLRFVPAEVLLMKPPPAEPPPLVFPEPPTPADLEPARELRP